MAKISLFYLKYRSISDNITIEVASPPRVVPSHPHIGMTFPLRIETPFLPRIGTSSGRRIGSPSPLRIGMLCLLRIAVPILILPYWEIADGIGFARHPVGQEDNQGAKDIRRLVDVVGHIDDIVVFVASDDNMPRYHRVLRKVDQQLNSSNLHDHMQHHLLYAAWFCFALLSGQCQSKNQIDRFSLRPRQHRISAMSVAYFLPRASMPAMSVP